MPTTRIGGFAIATASRAELTRAMLEDRAHRDRRGRAARLVVDANGHALSLAARDAGYREALAAADVIHADGGFLVTLSRWLGGARIAERSATTDMIHDFAAACAATGGSFYLLGGSETVNTRAAERLAALYPGLRIAGRHHGYFADEELDAMVAAINRAAPDVVWLGLGKPREQIVAAKIASLLTASWLVTCGGCFDFLAGAAPRAPLWLQRANLEWLYRLWRDPKRLFWRYATTNPHALWIVMVRWLRGPQVRRRLGPDG